MLTLGIDSGTQSTKTIVLDLETGVILASSQRSYEMIPGLPPGHLEQDPHVWINAVDDTVRECLAQLGARKNEVAAMGVSGQQHGLVVLNKENEPVRPAKLWCDTSTTEQCEQFAAEFGGTKGLIELTGNAILPGYTAPKILWLKQNESANYAAVNCFLLPHDFLNFWLTGEKRMEFGDASGTGLMDVKTRSWCRPIFDFIDPDLINYMPHPETSRAPAGLLREKLREQWGLEKSLIVSAGGGDNMMGAIGTGNIAPGVLTVSLGTSGTLYSYSEKPVIDPEGEVAAFCDSTDAWLPLICTMNVTVATERVRALFEWDHAQLEAGVRNAPAGADGLMFLPYLNGERTPNLPHGTGVLHGLTTSNMTREHLARATVEGVTLGLAYGLKRFRNLGLTPAEIRLTGGGSKSAAWRQICADIFNVPTVCLKSSEGAALGAAIQSWWAHENINGRAIPLRALANRLVTLDEETRCTPDKKVADLYAERLARQSDLTRKLHAVGYV
ncbi:MAG: xylulokinase [Chthoniobacter sp.]|jgi:xylulokinase|nr:xylulokinase [Chthoniobacter sp.]